MCYIVEKKGVRKQIGSTCVKDFLGHNPANMLRYSEIVFDMMDEWEICFSRIPKEESLESFLTYVASAIRTWGYRSRTKHDVSTADDAYEMLVGTSKHTTAMHRKTAPVRKESAAIAKRAISYAKKLKVPKGEDGTFLQNLKNIAINGAFLYTQIGFAAYIVQHYLINHEEDVAGHVGTVGTRLETTATVDSVNGYDSYYGDGRIVKFRDKENHILVWFTSSGMDILPGKAYKLAGTVKAHDEFKGKAQTVLSRCKLIVT